jgi:hypothetical protein
MLMTTLAAAALLAADRAGGVPALGWLSGAWVERSEDGRWTEEYWTPPRGHLMIGAGLTGAKGRVRHFEHMRIAADADGSIAFYAMPNGGAAVTFDLVRQTADEIVFENKAHDYPQRVAYRRDGERIVASTSLADGSREMKWTYSRP